MAKVTGIGGVSFKSANDHKELAEWYSRNLGIQLEPWGGAILKWTDDTSEDRGLTVWNVADKNTKWFSPSPSSFMISDKTPSTLSWVGGTECDPKKHSRIAYSGLVPMSP